MGDFFIIINTFYKKSKPAGSLRACQQKRREEKEENHTVHLVPLSYKEFVNKKSGQL